MRRVIQRARFCGKHGFDSVLIDDHLLYTAEAVDSRLGDAWLDCARSG